MSIRAFIADNDGVAVSDEEAIVWVGGLYQYYANRELAAYIGAARREQHLRAASQNMHRRLNDDGSYIVRHSERMRCELARITQTSQRKRHHNRLQYLYDCTRVLTA